MYSKFIEEEISRYRDHRCIAINYTITSSQKGAQGEARKRIENVRRRTSIISLCLITREFFFFLLFNYMNNINRGS